jgi:PEP-CTERM motif
MRRFSFALLLAVICAFCVSSANAQNLLANPSFEDPITFDGPPFVGSWEGFSGGGASAANNDAMPRTGGLHLLLSIDNTVNTFAGAFQDVPGLTPTTPVVFSGWHKTPGSPFGLVTEVRIEWRNSGTNSEVGRTPNSNPVPTGDYSEFSLPAVVPAGADTARVVYAIQSFTSPAISGQVYVDDASFVIVPEPASFGLAGLAGLGLLLVRRKS